MSSAVPRDVPDPSPAAAEEAFGTGWRKLAAADPRLAALQARLALLRSEEPAERARAQATLGLLMQRFGRNREATAHLRQAVAEAAPNDPLLPRFRLWAVRSPVLDGELGGAAGEVEAIATEAARSNDHVVVCEALNVLTLVSLCEGRTGAALELAQRAVALAEEHRVPAAETLNHLHLGLAWIEADRFDRARSALTKGYDRGEAGGPAGLRGLHLVFRALANFLSGQWDAALEDAGQSLEPGDDVLGTTVPLAISSMIASSRASEIPARELAVRAGAEEPLGAVGRFGAAWLALATTGLDERADAAHRALLDGWLHHRSAPYLLTWRLLDPLLVRCAVAVGDTWLADRLVEECQEGALRASGVPSARGAWLRVRAIAHDDVDAAREAVECYRASGRVIALAQTCLEAARILGRHGERAEAAELAVEAMRIFHRLEARRWSERAGRLHVDLLDGGEPGTTDRWPDGWEQLTPAQARVAQMAARGMTTAQIAERLSVTPHTVNSHLKLVYAKLHVSSRAQLAALFARGTAWDGA